MALLRRLPLRVSALLIAARILSMAAAVMLSQPIQATQKLAGPEPVIAWLHPFQPQEDSVARYVAQHLPHIRHEFTTANSIRIWKILEQGEKACAVGMLRTKRRESIAYFSNTHLNPRVELLLRKDLLVAMQLKDGEAVDLASFLKQRRWVGAFSSGRSYGDKVDALVSEFGDKKHLIAFATQDYGYRLLDMLDRGRFDFLLEFQGAHEYMRQRGLAADRFVALPIEGAVEPNVAGIACPRTDWGLRAIRAIDNVLGTPEAAAFLRRSSVEWLSPAALSEQRNQLEIFFLKRSKPSIID